MRLSFTIGGKPEELKNFVTRTIVMRDADAATRELEAKEPHQPRQITGSGADRRRRSWEYARSFAM